MCQLKRPLSKPFAIWLLQLLLSQLGFSIAFCSISEAEPVPVPAVLRKLNGCSFFLFPCCCEGLLAGGLCSQTTVYFLVIFTSLVEEKWL